MNKDLIKKMFVKNHKLIDKKETKKEDRQTLIKINKKLLELLEEK